MSEPLDFPEMMWAVMRPESTGLQFLRVQASGGVTVFHNPVNRASITLPPGVNLVMIDWSGSSRIDIRVRKDLVAYRIDTIDSGVHGTTRTLLLRLPVESAGHSIDVTAQNVSQLDVDQARCGVQIISTV